MLCLCRGSNLDRTVCSQTRKMKHSVSLYRVATSPTFLSCGIDEPYRRSYNMELFDCEIFSKISCSRGDECEDDSRLGYSALLSRWSRQTFLRWTLPPSSGRWWWSSTHFWNVGPLQLDHPMLCFRNVPPSWNSFFVVFFFMIIYCFYVLSFVHIVIY
jgi:hypothetical protein